MRTLLKCKWLDQIKVELEQEMKTLIEAEKGSSGQIIEEFWHIKIDDKIATSP